MIGVIVCGGQSIRMGSDKGLLKLEAKTWAQSAIDRMAGLNIPIKLSVNNVQYEGYQSIFGADSLIADDISLPLSGPLLGVLSCHLKNPGEDLFILACDMPLMETSVISDLYQTYRQQPGFDAYIYTNEGEPEPLCGIYSAKGLAGILDMLRKGELLRHSMKFMLDHLRVNASPVLEEQKKCFRNFNAHAELNGL